MSVTPFKPKQEEICPFCGDPEHNGYWECKRIRSVSMDTEGSWTVEFFEPDIEIGLEDDANEGT